MSRIAFIILVLSLLVQAGSAQAGHQGDRDTQTTVECLPDPTQAHQAVTCTAYVQDMYRVAGQRVAPTGTVNFSVITGPGNLSPTSCSSMATGLQGQSACSVTYTPTAGGTHEVQADYAGAVGPFNGLWLPSSGSATLTVSNPVPTITSVSPAIGVVYETLDVAINGSNFVSTGMTASFGAGITVNSVTWIDSTQVIANITIEAAAATGFRDVTVTNPAPAGGTGTLANAFEVHNPVPVISSLSPSGAEEGSGAATVTINGNNFVSGSIAYFNGSARTTTFVNSGQLTMELTAADTSVQGDYDVYVTNPAPGGGNSNTVTFSVVVSGGSFDVVESGQGVGGRLFTKIANAAFTVEILATDVGRIAINGSFTGDAAVELLDASDDSGGLDANGCRASWTSVQTLPVQSFTAADNGRISVSTTYADALPVARFRVSHPAAGTPTHVGCSSDAFAIRPASLGLSTTLNNTGTGGTPVHAAGAGFALSATGVAGYDGTPQIDAALFSAHAGAVAEGTLSGTFSAADPVTGASSASFSYDEVGNFTFDASGVYDEAFTAVDQPADCTDDFSNTLASGQYGCKFGNPAAVTVGRFVPHHFDVAVLQGCDADGFTYSGQPFSVTVTARDNSGAATRNFNYSATASENFAKDVTLSDEGDAANFVAPDNIILDDYFANGTATVNNVVYAFPDPETAYTTITLRAEDGDGASSLGYLEETAEIRSARLAMEDATEITTNNGYMNVIVQSWQETSPGVFEWAVNADDLTCTVLTTGSFNLDAASYTGNLAAGETSIINFSYASGEGVLELSAPGSGNDGSVDINVNTDSWLHFDWNGTGEEAPLGTMSFFEIFSTEPGLIYREEVIN